MKYNSLILPALIDEEDLATALFEVLVSKNVTGKPAHVQEEQADKRNRLDLVLSNASTNDEIYSAFCRAYEKKGPRYLNASAGMKYTYRYWALKNIIPTKSLCIQCNIEIDAVSIPDPGKDEIELDVVVCTCAKVDHIARFASSKKIILSDALDSLIENLRKVSNCVESSRDQQIIEQCLAIDFREKLNEQNKTVQYYNKEIAGSSYVWRMQQSIVRVRGGVDTSKYPFDVSLIEIQLQPSKYFDPSEVIFYQDAAAVGSSSLDCDSMKQPRGFTVSMASLNFEPIVTIMGNEKDPELMIRFGIILRRNTSGSLWRTFVPTLVVVGFGFVASITSIITGNCTESVMTQVLPAILISCVALQWTAAQLVPPSSGRTRMDIIFVLFYVEVLLLYTSLVLGQYRFGWLGFIIAFLLFLLLIVQWMCWDNCAKNSSKD